MKLADMQAQCQPSFRAPSGLSSCRQPFVSEAFSIHRKNETVEPRQRVLCHSSRVQAKGNLVHVATNMLRTHLMPRSINSALEECPHALDRVSVDVALRVLAAAVNHGAMVEPKTIQAFVSARLVCADQRSGFDISVDGPMQRPWHVMSAAGRKAISDAAKMRWKKHKAEAKKAA